MMKHTRPKGTKDFVPPDSERKQWAEEQFRTLAQRYGFREIVTPIIEHTELFIKSAGATSDIVTKEMYSFKDRGDRDITLRPEGTPGVVRALLEENLRRSCRLFYIGPMFRYSRPQKGRYREFYQLGAECFGEANPQTDAELIALGAEYYQSLGITDGETHLNSIGCRTCRPEYHQRLKGFLSQHRAELCPDCQLRAEHNPLRAFDCKNEQCQNLLANAPRAKDNLCPECHAHFIGVQEGLKQRQVSYTLNDRLVRGLDYYSRTAFEYISRTIGAQDSLGGGGRYDYLIEDFGGPPTPAVGFALGEERTLLAMPGTRDFSPQLVFVIALSAKEQPAGIQILAQLRTAGIPARMDYDNSKMKQQLRTAHNAAARYCVIIGENEVRQGTVALKDMQTGEQKEMPLAQAIATIKQTEGRGT